MTIEIKEPKETVTVFLDKRSTVEFFHLIDNRFRLSSSSSSGELTWFLLPEGPLEVEVKCD